MEVHGQNEVEDARREDRVMVWVLAGWAGISGLTFLLAVLSKGA